MQSMEINGTTLIVGCVSLTIAVWLWWIFHCRAVLARELKVMHVFLPICLFRGVVPSVKKVYETRLMEAVHARVEEIMNRDDQVLYAEDMGADYLLLRPLRVSAEKARNDFHQLRRALVWYGIFVYEDPSYYMPSELPAA
ncbi:MAG: hypothetical protein KW788_04515 [Candidatus Doudnabacteria bacterium]|nr:hypothetical protein [Candidatus Doudnabacteria bacterium]